MGMEKNEYVIKFKLIRIYHMIPRMHNGNFTNIYIWKFWNRQYLRNGYR